METFVKIRDKETGLFKQKRSTGMNGWSEAGDMYSPGRGEAVLKSLQRRHPKATDRFEVVRFGAFELKQQDWLTDDPTTVPKERITWDSIRDNKELEQQFYGLMWCILEDLCEEDCDGDLPITVKYIVRPNEMPNHYDSLLHNHDDDPEVAQENLRTAQMNLATAAEDMRRAMLPFDRSCGRLKLVPRHAPTDG